MCDQKWIITTAGMAVTALRDDVVHSTSSIFKYTTVIFGKEYTAEFDPAIL
jgi:hypothetical protein